MLPELDPLRARSFINTITKDSIADASLITGLSRPQTLRATVPKNAFRQVPNKRAYTTELAQALVEASRNIGMGSAAIGLAGTLSHHLLYPTVMMLTK